MSITTQVSKTYSLGHCSLRKFGGALGLAWLLLCFLLGCSASDDKTIITIKGSDSMVILMQQWAERFPDKNVRFQVTGGGTGTGFSALINGTTDICAASRRLRYDEVVLLSQRNGYPGMEVRVARDGLAVYVNKKNPIHNLTIEQVRDIFTGKIENWQELGGADAPIVLYSRENNSGTYFFFKENVLKGENFSPKAQYLVGTGALVRSVGQDKNGIGFGGVAYTGNVIDVALAEADGEEYIYPSEQNILTGRYPESVSRLLYLYTARKPEGYIKEFIDWILSSEGQEIVRSIGYFPVITEKWSSNE